MRFFEGVLCALALSVAVVGSFFTGLMILPAFAQDVPSASDIAAFACANDAAWLKWALGVAFVPIVSSIVIMLKSPPAAGTWGRVLYNVLRVLALAWGKAEPAIVQLMRQSSKAAPVLLVALPLLCSACGSLPSATTTPATTVPGSTSPSTPASPSASDPVAVAQQFASQVQAFNANLNQNLAQFAQGGLIDTQALGKSACGYASMANGLFKLAAPIMTVAGVDPAVGATEAGVMTAVDLGCAVIDNADPSTPAATVANATAQVLAAVPQIKAALQTASPSLAAAASAPLPATAPPAPAAGSPAST